MSPHFDPAVEFKYSLRFAEGTPDASGLLAPVAAAWTRASGTSEAMIWDPKKCRSIQFWDTPDRRLYDGSVRRLARLRARRDSRKSCFDDDGVLLPVDEKWDLSFKVTSPSSEARDAALWVDAKVETDWLASMAEPRFRYSASSKEKDGAPPETGAEIAAKCPSGFYDLGGVQLVPVCGTLVEQLKVKGKHTTPELELTVWRFNGAVMSAEASFEGSADQLAFAQEFASALTQGDILAERAVSKTKALFQDC